MPCPVFAAFGEADQLRLDVEAFYFVADRIIDLSQHRDALPGISPVEAPGVQRVRNNLVAHAHKKSGNLAMTFSVNSDSGTRLRDARRTQDLAGYQDPGIHRNATEFREQVRRSLEAALREPPLQEKPRP